MESYEVPAQGIRAAPSWQCDGRPTLILGALYLGWYHWPGWYLSEAVRVILMMVAVDVVLGPLLTLIVASSKKSFRVLGRDIGIIVTVQLVALLYGATTLWSGRPLYYAFSTDCLEVVQASDIDAEARKASDRQKLALAPHWYSLPRWIWAPLRKDPDEAQKIVADALQGGADVTALPQYYRPWDQILRISVPSSRKWTRSAISPSNRKRCSRNACWRPVWPWISRMRSGAHGSRAQLAGSD